MFRNLKYLINKKTISFENNENETITLKYPLYVRVLLSFSITKGIANRWIKSQLNKYDSN